MTVPLRRSDDGACAQGETARADFHPRILGILGGVSCLPLAQGLRRALLVAAAHDGDNDTAEMGVLVLAEDDSIELANAAAQGWLAELRQPEHAHLPFVIQAVASRARRARRAMGAALQPVHGSGRRRDGGSSRPDRRLAPGRLVAPP
jgi:hypothetical protein